MLKDKPAQYLPAKVNSKRQRVWSLSAIAAIILTYYIVFFRASDDKDSHPLYGTKVDWSRYAYSQYATDQHYLCNSVMIFDSLHKLGSKADQLLFYPKNWDVKVESSKDRISQLLVMARDKYKVKLKPVDMYTLKRAADDQDETTWDASINKLHAFKQGEYDRIIHLDSDITVLQNLDELFFLPSATIAMPRAYWKLDEPVSQGGGRKLTSLLIVLKPSEPEANAIWEQAAGLDSSIPSTNMIFDMELLNQRYADTALILPHRNYALVTGEFRRPGQTNHTRYLGNNYELWDPHRAIKEAKLVHFSDWPVPKPWIATPNSLLREMRPACEYANGTPDEKGCDDRKIWLGLYDDFRRRRKEVCALLSVPAPEWPPRMRPGKQGVNG